MYKLLKLGTFFLYQSVSFYKAWVFMLLFNWFAVTAFNIPELTYWLSYGLILAFSVLKMDGHAYSLAEGHYETNQMDYEELVIANLTRPLVIAATYSILLFIGWAVQGAFL